MGPYKQIITFRFGFGVSVVDHYCKILMSINMSMSYQKTTKVKFI